MPHVSSGNDATSSAEWLVPLVLVLPMAAYLVAAVRQSRASRGWSLWRTASCVFGIGLLAVALSPPVTSTAHHDLSSHMVQHLLIGMFAPLALVMAAPVTLLLRTVPVETGRRIASLLRSHTVHVLSHPVTTLGLNVGGMYVLYLTPLFAASLANPWLHWLVYIHFLLAGYVFAWAIAGPDPAPNRPGMTTRISVLTAAIATHAFLGKLMYAHHWPRGASFDAEEIRAAAELMYYGGDLAEFLLAVALFASWYHHRHKRRLAHQRSELARHAGTDTTPSMVGLHAGWEAASE